MGIVFKARHAKGESLQSQQVREKIDILVFDSGVGGLSILGELRSALVPLRYVYLADTAGLPYGNKEPSWLLDRVMRVFEAVLARCEPRLAVIACNTASTLVLPHLRARFPFPIVGVVPAIKPAAARSRSHVIGLLATPATITRSYTDELIRSFAAQCRVIRVGSSELVGQAEKKLRGEAVDLDLIRQICQPLQDPQLDVIVLGCTHFPFLSQELHEIFPERVQFVDSGAAIAQRVRQLLPSDEKSRVEEGKSFALVTGGDDVGSLRRVFAAYGMMDPDHLELLMAPSSDPL